MQVQLMCQNIGLVFWEVSASLTGTCNHLHGSWQIRIYAQWE